MEPHEDIPPPPYSETDIYSQSGSHHPASATAANSGSGAGAGAGAGASLVDDAASIAASSSPGGTNIIYTPPETPREESPHRRQLYDYDYGNGRDHHNPTNAPAFTQAYFESRPVPAHLQAGHQSTITPITADISPALPPTSSGQQPPPPPPYPDWAPARDVTEQDWHAFVNDLLPPAGANNGVVVDSNGSSVSAPQQRMENALRDWNTGFFGPRGVTVIVTVQHQDPLPPAYSSAGPPSAAVAAAMREAKMPRGEDEKQGAGTSLNNSSSSSNNNNNNRGRRPPADEPATAGGAGMSSSSGGRWNPFEISNRGVRIGPLTIDGDRVAIGDRFQVDSQGVRWGGYSAGSAGVSIGGQSVPNPFGQGGHNAQWQPGGERGRGFGWGGGRGRGGFSAVPWNLFDRATAAAQAPAHPHPPPGHHRSRSVSSVSSFSPSSSSSSSSSSDSDSDSSIGSLPDWDDLEDAQLPITKQSISAWLAHPEQPVTKAMLKAARANIRAASVAAQAKRTAAAAANNGNNPDYQGQGQQEEKADPATRQQQQQQQRQEVKNLLEQFKALKRRQRDTHRADRRRRRDEKKAARRARKDVKKARKEQRKAERRARRTVDRAGRRAEKEKAKAKWKGKDKGKCKAVESSGGYGSDVPHPPHIPPMPAMPAMPAIPAMPHVPPGPGGFGPFGDGRGRGGGLFGSDRGGSFGFRGRGGWGGAGEGGSSHRFPPWARNHYDGDGWNNNNNNSRGNGDEDHRSATEGILLFDADSVPGAWPTAAAEKEALSPPSHLSAKYEAVDRIEVEMAIRAEELRTLRQRGGGYEQKDQGKEGKQGSEQDKLAEAEADKLEAEMRRLGAEVERLRLEADEEFARGLVEEGANRP